MGLTMVSATLASSVALLIWRHGANMKYFNFAHFHRKIFTRTSSIQMEPKHINVGKKMSQNRFLISNILADLKGPNLYYG